MRSNSNGRKGPNQQSGARRRLDATASDEHCLANDSLFCTEKSFISEAGTSHSTGTSSASIPCGTTRRQQETQRPDQSRWKKLKPQKRSKAISPAADERAKDSHIRVAAVAQKPTDKDIALHRSHFKSRNPTRSSACTQRHSARIAVKVLSQDINQLV